MARMVLVWCLVALAGQATAAARTSPPPPKKAHHHTPYFYAHYAKGHKSPPPKHSPPPLRKHSPPPPKHSSLPPHTSPKPPTIRTSTSPPPSPVTLRSPPPTPATEHARSPTPPPPSPAMRPPPNPTMSTSPPRQLQPPPSPAHHPPPPVPPPPALALLNVFVKLDKNYNSTADSDDWPLAGVTVKLIRKTRRGGLHIAEGTSDGFGIVGFTVAAPHGATYHLAVENPPLEGTQLALRLPHVPGTPAHNFTLRTGTHGSLARTPSFGAPPGSALNFTLLVQDTQVPSISFDIVYENKAGMWELDVNGTQLPVTYRAADPAYRNKTIPGNVTANSTTTYTVHGLPVTPDAVFTDSTVFTVFAFASDNLGVIQTVEVSSSVNPFLVQSAFTEPYTNSLLAAKVVIPHVYRLPGMPFTVTFSAVDPSGLIGIAQMKLYPVAATPPPPAPASHPPPSPEAQPPPAS